MSNDWRRRYPPLSGAVIATVLAVLVLPSALNVPQSNPTQTLEFAPIPPEDDQPPPPDSGNVDRLGLGSSSTFAGDATGGGDGPGLPPPPEIPGGIGDRPVTKRCVGDPPRQTADPLAPPCVAHFEGDNGGTTYQGVTGDEVRVLAYADGKTYLASEAGSDYENDWKGRCKDISSKPPSDDETMTFRIMRRLQAYFNERYQTYERKVGFVLCFSPHTAGNTTAETRLADAARMYNDYRPFAVLTSGLVDGYQDTFMNYMADHGAMVFGSSQGARPAEFFRQYPGLIWTVPPTLERKADRFIDHVCQKVVPFPVSDAGDASMDGEPRVLGLTHTSDNQRWPQLLQAKDRVKAGIEACGGAFKVEVTFPRANAQFQSSYSGQYALQNMSQMQANGVTTIIWPGGFENEQSEAAAQIGYQPEWVVLGMGYHEGNNLARVQHPDVWDHAWLVTTTSRTWPRDQDPCRQAANEADPSIKNQGEIDTCDRFPYYEDLRQLFTGIQVAGPNLTPTTIDRGFHAIPAVRSTSPFVPACYYAAADYTCIKDAMVEHWDPQGVPPDGQPGCWRLVEGGLRYPDRWPDGNLDAQAQADDPCNTDVSSAALFAPAPR